LIRSTPKETNVMRTISLIALVASHIALVLLFFVFGVFAFMMSYAIVFFITGQPLATIHDGLGASVAFHRDIGFLIAAISALGTGWFASSLAKRKPLLHGALSSALLSLGMAFVVVHDIVISPVEGLTTIKLWPEVTVLSLPFFGFIGAYARLYFKGGNVSGGSRAPT
jgi:hypothetical protein